jgi:GNAT superfamily N-acetyltransferase
MEIRVLLPTDERRHFSSGNIELDRFFQRFAGQNQFRLHLGVTHVAIEAGAVLGFATVSAAQVRVRELSPADRKGLPAYPVPVIRLSRLAVAQTAQGRGIGAALLRHVNLLAVELSRDKIGCAGVLVDAKPEARAFYARYGFIDLALEEGALAAHLQATQMFLGVRRIRAALPSTH